MDPYELSNDVDLGFIDFMDEANLEQFMELIRTEAQEPAVHQFCANWDCDHGIGCLTPPTAAQFVPIPDDLKLSSLCDLDSFPEHRDDIVVIENHDEIVVIEDRDEIVIIEDEEKKNGECFPSSTQATGKTKVTDRSRTIISERKRRSIMKDKLHALRSLVPYITKMNKASITGDAIRYVQELQKKRNDLKMNKASIIGDAIRYVQELQKKRNDLKVEIAGLESSLNQPPVELVPILQDDCNVVKPPPIKQILQMEVFQVELREFYVRIMCIKSEGIAALLYRSLDSIGLNVQSSNLATNDDLNYLFTFTLNANEAGREINLQNLKLWIAAALCDQGFQGFQIYV